ncbi:MAG: DMT family transporter [Pseudomonadota bacterium]
MAVMEKTQQVSAQASVAPSMARAVVWLGLAMVAFTGINTMVREITQQLHPFELLFWRNLFAVALILPFLVLTHGRRALHLNRPKLVIGRSITEGLVMCCVFTAFSGLPLAEATAIIFTNPIWITIAAGLFLGETVRMRRWVATLIGFLGMLVIVRPGGGDFSIYTGAALAGAILIAISTISLRRASQSDSPGRIICWMSIIITPFGFILAQPYWQGPTPELFAMIALAVAFGTVGHYSLTTSYRYAEASQTAPYLYVQLLLAAISGFIVFGELPTLYTYIGGVIIAGSGIYIAHREHVAQKRAGAAALAADPAMEPQPAPAAAPPAAPPTKPTTSS